jgi:hypothetical protein
VSIIAAGDFALGGEKPSSISQQSNVSPHIQDEELWSNRKYGSDSVILHGLTVTPVMQYLEKN